MRCPGEKKGIPVSVYRSMCNRTCIYCGQRLNVGIVAFVVILFLKVLRLPERAFLCGFAFIARILLLTGASHSGGARYIMAVIYVRSLMEARADIYNSLSIAALFILALNPNQSLT